MITISRKKRLALVSAAAVVCTLTASTMASFASPFSISGDSGLNDHDLIGISINVTNNYTSNSNNTINSNNSIQNTNNGGNQTVATNIGGGSANSSSSSNNGGSGEGGGSGRHRPRHGGHVFGGTVSDPD